MARTANTIKRPAGAAKRPTSQLVGWKIPVLAILGLGVIIALALVWQGGGGAQTDRLAAGYNVLGSASAPVVVEDWSDFQ
ncbi:MAG: hypothetical protein HY329_21170 [Chloroflexi bacterium]|nr:hypothetical protein [Chloroflexota bacterium]